MKPLKVNYRKKWGTDGTCYTQTITLDKKFIKYFNKMVKYYHSSPAEIQFIIEDTISFSHYYNFYLEEIDIKKEFNFINNTQLKALFYYLSINNYDVSKILNRNTIIKSI